MAQSRGLSHTRHSSLIFIERIFHHQEQGSAKQNLFFTVHVLAVAMHFNTLSTLIRHVGSQGWLGNTIGRATRIVGVRVKMSLAGGTGRSELGPESATKLE